MANAEFELTLQAKIFFINYPQIGERRRALTKYRLQSQDLYSKRRKRDGVSDDRGLNF